jgi:hypothetical protein
MYKPGLPGNRVPVLFDISIDWKPALQCVRLALETYANPAQNLRTDEEVLKETYANPAETYAINVRKTDPITILNYTVLERGDPKALAEAGNKLLNHLLALDQWDVIADPASHAGLLHSGQIQTWLESGADPNRDIIQTVQAKLTHLHNQGKRRYVKSWEFFTKAISEAKARRERGLPQVILSDGEDQVNGSTAAPNSDAAYAAHNITVEKGRVTIGEALRRDLRCDGYSDNQIDRHIAAPRNVPDRGPVA